MKHYLNQHGESSNVLISPMFRDVLILLHGLPEPAVVTVSMILFTYCSTAASDKPGSIDGRSSVQSPSLNLSTICLNNV